MKLVRSRLTYANVMATVAVFIALGGASYAAIKLPKNSVGTKQIKSGAVTEDKIKDGAISAGKLAPGAIPTPTINPSTLGTVPSATRATTATNADHATTADNAATAGRATTADTATTAGRATDADHAGASDQATNASNAANSAKLEGKSAADLRSESELRCPADYAPVLGYCIGPEQKPATFIDAAIFCAEREQTLPSEGVFLAYLYRIALGESSDSGSWLEETFPGGQAEVLGVEELKQNPPPPPQFIRTFEPETNLHHFHCAIQETNRSFK